MSKSPTPPPRRKGNKKTPSTHSSFGEEIPSYRNSGSEFIGVNVADVDNINANSDDGSKWNVNPAYESKSNAKSEVNKGCKQHEDKVEVKEATKEKLAGTEPSKECGINQPDTSNSKANNLTSCFDEKIEATVKSLKQRLQKHGRRLKQDQNGCRENSR